MSLESRSNRTRHEDEEARPPSRRPRAGRHVEIPGAPLAHKTLTPLGARSTGYLRLPALGRGRPPSHHGTCLPRALPTETLPERDSRQDPIERPKTPPTSKDAADGGSPFKRCGHLIAALTELAAAPEMAIDQGFYVGLDGIEPSTSALSVLLSSQTTPPLRCGYVTNSA